MTIGLLRPTRRRTERRREGATDSAYAAFISYSHAADGKLAPALQRGLHGFARPLLRLRALRVFRDEASLSVNPGLWSSIEQALGDSTFFILLASPEAAGSPWVGREISYWVHHKSPETFLIVLTDGEVVWNNNVGDFDWTRTTALPPSLRGVFTEEPRHIDLRWARMEEDVSLHNPRFRNAIADLAAPLHHRSKDELIGEDVHQHRRTIRWVRSAVATLTVLLILALTATVVAVDRQQVAREQQRVAEDRARTATARQMAATAVSHLESDLQLAQLLAVEAHRMHPDPQTRSALFRAVTASPRLVRYLDAGSEVSVLNGSGDGAAAVGGTEEGYLVHWNLVTGAHERIRIGTEAVMSVAVDYAGTRIVGTDGARAVLWDSLSGQEDVVAAESATSVAISPSGDRAALLIEPRSEADASDETLELALFDLDSRRQLNRVPVASLTERVGLSDDGTVTLITGAGVWERRSLPDLGVIASSDQTLVANYGSSGASGDGSYFLWGAFGEVKVWDVAHSPGNSTFDSPDLQATTGAFQSFYEAVTASPDGSLVAAAAAGAIHVASVSTDSRTVAYAEELVGNSRVNAEALTFVGNNRLVSATESSMAFWDLQAIGRIGIDLGVELPFACRSCQPYLSPSPDGRFVTFVDGAFVSGQATAYRLDGTGTPQTLSHPGASIGGALPDGYKVPVWSHDGKRLILLGFGDDTALTWDAEDLLRPSTRWPSAASSEAPVAARVSADGSRVVILNGDGAAVVRRSADGTVLRTLDGEARLDRLGWPPPPTAAAVSRDLTTAALVEQEEVSLVDTETGGRRSLPGGPADSVFFTQDHLLVLRPDGAVEIWKADGRRLVASATGGGYRVALAAPMDGHLLARLRTDDSITVTLSESGDSLGSLALPPTNGYITRIAFTEDGEFLVAGTAGGSLTRWDMTETAWLSHACDAAGRDLNSEEWQRYVGTATPTDLGCRR